MKANRFSTFRFRFVASPCDRSGSLVPDNLSFAGIVTPESQYSPMWLPFFRREEKNETPSRRESSLRLPVLPPRNGTCSAVSGVSHRLSFDKSACRTMHTLLVTLVWPTIRNMAISFQCFFSLLIDRFVICLASLCVCAPNAEQSFFLLAVRPSLFYCLMTTTEIRFRSIDHAECIEFA